ncbi:phytanoyl-CoA dioxygenase family protein [Paraburkholderia hospita]|jgi:ectoine hydroxylase-related dioxygenase (phytanoyl-CoA dioxygenase family)|uniref:Phytanoyl-CoA dioxygenase n=1 Tax=Paraburkholderia hospita TaxID=169430 RepID=A0AAN1JIW0_9BURK|nr:phytanoyl-CoA dioxygenase family protein [Paraburkholderia hospita]AUT74840.1 phytanoyl-CoA dioxygenase [Paraburkholderia hospita]EIM95025.1 phytanoyl-CoA dioxygenase [Paraburkholderia hospita]OUL80041.1 phytanoyl-CoA dioxygenase [Paraburkholderia hospita]OUL91858.1 phytanoyl-CoA dioxygenase [Paraburkholderia hospita]SEH68678.1 Phytanoyl-CoA dioxygenase (PhyH) [Paraburkholderia hospita]
MLQDIDARIERALTPELIADFRRDGAVCIRKLFTDDDIALLREGIERNIAQPSPRAKVASRPDDPGWFFEDFCNWQDNDAYRRFIYESAAPTAAGALIGGETVRLYHDHLLVKEPNTRQRTPWHQDQPYYNISGSQNVSMWIPVDPVSRESTLEFVAGSHLGPWLMPRTFMDNEAKWFPEGSLADLPDIESNRAAYPIIGWALEPGDMVCFNMLTLHASGGVGGNTRRRAFSVRFIGDDVRHAPRRWRTSPDFPGLDAQLPEGAPMDHPLFPVLWRVSAS